MLRLLLLRHAKSDPADVAVDDRDRALTPRGRRAAQAIGRWLASHRLEPDLVLCSPARRARDTWSLVAAEFKTNPRTLVDEALYDFGDGSRHLEAIARLGGDAKCLLVVAHNPATERLAGRLAGRGKARLRDRMAQKFPTAGLAVIGLDIAGWASLDGASGELEHFVRPKDILSETGD